jgi:hypothetical protein
MRVTRRRPARRWHARIRSPGRHDGRRPLGPQPHGFPIDGRARLDAGERTTDPPAAASGGAGTGPRVDGPSAPS